MPKTQHPVTFKHLQATLNGLGYGLSRHDPIRPILHWYKETVAPAGVGENWPPHLTTLKPDFSAEGHSEPVYDRSYIIDLLINIFGDEPDGAGTRLAIVAHQIATAER